MASLWKCILLWLTILPCIQGATTSTTTTTTTPLVCRSSPTTTTTTMAPVTTTMATVTTTKATTKIPFKVFRRFFHRPGVGFQRKAGIKTGCLQSCYRIRNGKYPSCSGCNYIAACYHGNLYLRKCYPGYEWDAYRRTCTFFSSTCSSVVSYHQPLSRSRYSFF